MKAIIVTIAMAFATLATLELSANTANDAAYRQAIEKGLASWQAAETPEALRQTINHFGRVAMAQPDKWLPNYYAANILVLMAARTKDVGAGDALLDEAQTYIDRALAVEANNSELTAMQGFVHMIRMALDPATRGAQYMGKVMQVLSQATAQNPENPRALYLLAQAKYGTAQFFGNDVTEVCAMFDRAYTLVEAEHQTDPLLPSWGRKEIAAMQQICK